MDYLIAYLKVMREDLAAAWSDFTYALGFDGSFRARVRAEVETRRARNLPPALPDEPLLPENISQALLDTLERQSPVERLLEIRDDLDQETIQFPTLPEPCHCDFPHIGHALNCREMMR